MKIKTTDLKGSALNWAVAKLENVKGEIRDGFFSEQRRWGGDYNGYDYWQPVSFSQWDRIGPIITRYGIGISLRYHGFPDVWDAIIKPEHYASGRPNSGVKREVIASGCDPQEAACRCFILACGVEELDVPDELL